MIYNGDLFDTTDLQGLSLGEYWFKIQVFAAAQDLTLLGFKPTSDTSSPTVVSSLWLEI